MSSTMRRARPVSLLALLVGACAVPPAADGASSADSGAARATRADTARAPARQGAPRVLGACCVPTDSAALELLGRYERTTPADRTPELALVAYRFSSGLEGRVERVVRDSASWARIWVEIVGSHRPVAPLPAVDFSREMLVVASMGTQRTGGYAIWIEDLSVVNDTIRVAVREQRPGSRCGTTAALTQPVTLARVERSDLPVAFVSSLQTSDCP
jgi:hypothetical protein